MDFLLGTMIELTQTTFGLSRDGVGKLMKLAVELGRTTRKDIKLGSCGEHGGDPSSVEFCHRLGLDYVSCSPFRIPITRSPARDKIAT